MSEAPKDGYPHTVQGNPRLDRYRPITLADLEEPPKDSGGQKRAVS